MNEHNEKISAWLDDGIELDEIRSLHAETSNDTYSVMARYNMIGDAVRNRVSDASMIDISANVRAAIAAEPALTKPALTRRRARQPMESWLGLSSWLKPVGGLAVAATVAMVMVVTLTDQHGENDGSAVVANVDQQPVQSMPVSADSTDYTQPGLALPAVNLNNYVKHHTEYAAQDTIQGMMPYARAVSYGAEKNNPSQAVSEDGQTEKPVGK